MSWFPLNHIVYSTMAVVDAVQMADQGLMKNLTIVTHNIDEFIRVLGLCVEDWVWTSIPPYVIIRFRKLQL